MQQNLFSKRQLLIFGSSFLVVFLMTSLRLLGINLHTLISPLPHTQADAKKDVFPTLMPKLKAIPNGYSLRKTASLISQANAAGDYENAAAYVVVDYTSGTVVADKNLDAPLPIASLTKIMSSVVAMDILGPVSLITISPKAADVVPTKIGVVPGQQMTTTELVTAALMTSANDAAESLRQGVDNLYGEGTFVRAMNAKAEAIGLKHSHFANPQGFDSSENYSTVEDLAILSHYALSNYPIISEIAKKDYFFMQANENHKQFDLYNWNGLLDVYPNTIGLKIGNTGDAGYTTVVVSNRENKQMLAVVLGAPGILKRDEWAAELLDYGYQTTYGLDPINVTEDMLREKYATWQYWN